METPPATTPTAPIVNTPVPPKQGEPFSVTLDAIGRNKDAIVEIVKQVGNEVQSARTTTATTSRQVSVLIVVFLGIVVVGSGLLVWQGSISDGSFTFMMGVMIGYLMQFFDRLNFGGSE